MSTIVFAIDKYRNRAQSHESGRLNVLDDIDQVGERRATVICSGKVCTTRKGKFKEVEEEVLE